MTTFNELTAALSKLIKIAKTDADVCLRLATLTRRLVDVEFAAVFELLEYAEAKSKR